MNRARARARLAGNRGYITRPLSRISGTITRPAGSGGAGGRQP